MTDARNCMYLMDFEGKQARKILYISITRIWISSFPQK
jgi:hypothetical protein